MVLLSVLGFMVSLVTTLLCIRLARGMGDPYALQKPQRFHAGSVSRLGGVGVLLGAVTAWFLCFQQRHAGQRWAWTSGECCSGWPC